MAMQETPESMSEEAIQARQMAAARTRLASEISIAKQVGYDPEKLEKLKDLIKPDPESGGFNLPQFNAALSAEHQKIASTPGGKSYFRAGELKGLTRFEGDFDWKNTPYVDQIIQELGAENPYTASIAMNLAQKYGVTSLRDLSFDKKTIPGYTDYNLNPDSPTVIPDKEVPVVKIKSTGKVIPNDFASYDNGGTNKNGGATFYFSWDLNPDGSPTIRTGSNPRAGGFVNDVIKPILPFAALFIPVIGPEIGASLLAGTALAGNAAVAMALGNAVANLSIQALSGNIKSPSDVLKIMGAAGVSAGIAEMANLVTPEGPGVPGAYSTDAGKLVDSLTGGAITGKLADIVGGMVQGGLTGLASDSDPTRGAILGGTARLSGVLSQSVAASTGSQAIGTAVATALNTAVVSGRLDTALSSGGIAGLNAFLNETLDSTAREQKLTPDQTKALKAGGALALQTIVAGAPNPQQAIQIIATTLKNDYEANKKKLPITVAESTPDNISPGLLNVADANGNLNLGSLYVSSIPKNYSDFVKFASANTGTISDVSVALPSVLVQGNSEINPNSFFESLAESAKDALGLNGPSDRTLADVGQQLFNGIVWIAKNAPKDDPKNPINDLMRSVGYTVLSGGVDSLGAVNALNGVLKTIGVTTQGGSLDQFANRVKILSDALTPPAAKAQEEAFAREWANVKNAQDVFTVLAKAPFNYPLATLKQVISEVGEEGLQLAVTGGAAGVAKLLSSSMKVGASIGRKADFAYEVVEAAGGSANDAAKNRAEVLQKDLASGKITQQQFNAEVEAARAKGALTGLVIGTVANKVPDLPKVTDATTTSTLNRVVANTLIATANVIGKEGLPAAATDYLNSIATGKEVSGLDLLKTGALESALSKLTSSTINTSVKARDAGANIYNSFKDAGIDSNKTFDTADADIRSLIKSGGNIGSLTSKVSDSFANGGVMPEVAEVAAKRYVGGTVDKVLYDTLKQNNVAEDKIDKIIGSVTDSVLQGGKPEEIINKFSQELQKNGVDIKTSDAAQTNLFGTSQEKKQAEQYDKRVSELITQGSPVADAQTKAQNELGLTQTWVDWNKSTKQPVSVSPSTSTSQVSVSNISVSSSPIGSSSVVLVSVSASKSASASNSTSISLSKSASISDRVFSISSSKSASASSYVSKSTSASASASLISVSRSVSKSTSTSSYTSKSISASQSSSLLASTSKSASTSSSISASTSSSLSTSTSKSASTSKSISASTSSSLLASTSKSTSVSLSSVSASVVASISNSKSASVSASQSTSSSIVASKSASVSALASKSISTSNSTSASKSASISTVASSVSTSKSISTSTLLSVSTSKSISTSVVASSASASKAKPTPTPTTPSESISISKSVSASNFISISNSNLTSASVSKSISTSKYASASASYSASVIASQSERTFSISTSKSLSVSKSISVSTSSSTSTSVVASSISASKSAIAYKSASVSASQSASQSTSISNLKSISTSVSASVSTSKSTSVSNVASSASVSKSVSLSAPTSASASKSNSISSVSSSVSISKSQSASKYNSISQSTSVSKSASISNSLSAKASPSESIKASISKSTQESISSSIKKSIDISNSQSTSASLSLSTSALASASAKASPSVSISASVTPSATTSVSASISTSISASVTASASTSITASASTSITASASASVTASTSTSVTTSTSTSVSASTSTSVSTSVSTSFSPSISTSVSASFSESSPPSSLPPISSETISSSPPISSEPPSSSPLSSSPPSSSPPSSSPPSSSPPKSSPPVSSAPPSSSAPKGGFQFTVPQIAEVAAATTPFLETTTKIIGGTPQYKGILDQFFAKAKEPLAPAPKLLESQMPKQQYYEYGESTPIGDILGETGEQPATEEQGFAKGGLAAPFEKLYKSGKMRIDFRRGDAVSGPGDGQSDDIPAMLADGEFVFPADVVAALGNGSTKAGSEQLYKMMHDIRARARKAAPKDLPPKALSPLEYMKRRK